jgi:carbamoyl-phosphate synthase large subunit
MNILITSAGRRVSLVRAFRKELRKHFSDGKVYAVDMKPELSSACMISDNYFKVPAVSDPSYCNVVNGICRDNGIALIIPTIDTELTVLSENRDFFTGRGIIPVISAPDVISMCQDKRKTHSYFDSTGFPRCREIDPLNAGFPLFAKPVDGSSSIGIKLIEEPAQLTDSLVKSGRMMFLEYLDPKYFTEFTIDLYFDKNNDLKCAVPRERIEVRGGEVSKAVTRRDDLYDIICDKFFHCEGFTGCITLQVFRKKDTRELFGIEINPRFGGGYPLSYMAKANFPEMIIKEYLMNEKLPFFDSWTVNLLMLRYDDEIIINDYKG